MNARILLVSLLLAATVPALPAADRPAPADLGGISFLGTVDLPKRLEIDGTEVGGLSALTWDAERGVYYAVSDDPGWRSPVRFYTLEIDLEGGRLAADGVRVRGVTPLLDPDGRPFGERAIDGEGLTLTPTGTLLLSSEGNVEAGVPPSLWEFGLDGVALRQLRVPRRYLPNRAGRRGVRHNQAFEGLALAADGRDFFVGIESALVQDGPAADLERPSRCRIGRFDLASGRPRGDVFYLADPVAAPPQPPDGLAVNGLVEILALDRRRLLALERSFSVGVGNDIRLYLVELPETVRERRGWWRRSAPPTAPKRLLLDLGELEIPLDNLEGMTLGPDLADGRRSLLLVSDDNFSPDRQRTQILAFALALDPPAIPDLQGSAHRSPWTDSRVWGVTGVVTAVSADPRAAGFWFQDPQGDGDPTTSDGLFVATGQPPAVHPGDEVRVAGRIAENGRGRGLTVTRIDSSELAVEGSDRPLPPAVRIGPSGRAPSATVIDDDGLASYQPDTDAIDFYESLEGMRVEVADGVVVGATNRYGLIVVAPDGGAGAGPRTPRGGLLLRPDDANPERLPIASTLLPPAPPVNVGDRLPGSVAGVLDYAFGSYRLLHTAPLPEPVRLELPEDRTALAAGGETLTIATYNLLNVDPSDPEEKYRRLAESIVHGLGSPDLLAVQEVQDDSGPADDGTVTAAANLSRLTAAIARAGGPAYSFGQIDPVDGANGGQPGGNIRNAFLWAPERVRPVADALAVLEHAAFRADPDTGYAPSRFPLLGEFEFREHRIRVVNLHLKSKGGDDPLFGARQPPVRATEAQRLHQAAAVGEWVAERRAEDPCATVVVLGDLNEFDFRPPVESLAGYGLVNLMSGVPVEDRYSFVFEGNSQLLDHILIAPQPADPAAVEIDIAHLNADFADGHRASDHDPVVARLELASAPGCAAAAP